MEYKVKMNGTICFDDKTEQDIIESVENLKARHKLGSFTSALIRVAHDNPEVMKLVMDEFKGMTSDRDEFFKSVNKQITSIKADIETLNIELAAIIADFKYGASASILNKAYNVALASVATDRHLQQLKKSISGSLIVDADKNLLDNFDKVSDLAVEKIVKLLEDIEVNSILAGIKNNTQANNIVGASSIQNNKNDQNNGTTDVNSVRTEEKASNKSKDLKGLMKLVGTN